MVGLMSLVLSFLDTGAGPNPVRESELPPGVETLVSFGTPQDIGDAKNRPLCTLGTTEMPSMRLGNFMTTAEFIVCEKLEVPHILRADNCDRFVEAVYPRRKKVDLTDLSEVPIVRTFSLRRGKINLIPGEEEGESRVKRVSPKLKVARAATGMQQVV